MRVTRRQLRSLIGDLLSEGANPCPGAYKFANIIGDIKIEIKDTVRFITGKAVLKPESYKLLDAIACLMNNDVQLKDKNLRVEGHTDSVGGDNMNMRLSQGRAKSVSDYLVSAGVAKERVSSDGLGETKPIASNDSDAGRTKNRRVEFHIIKDWKGPEIRRVQTKIADFPSQGRYEDPEKASGWIPAGESQPLGPREGKQLTRRHLRRLIESLLVEQAPSRETHWGSGGTLKSSTPEEERYGISPRASGKKVGQAADPMHAYQSFGNYLQDVVRRYGMNFTKANEEKIKTLLSYYTEEAALKGFGMAINDMAGDVEQLSGGPEGQGKFAFDSCDAANKYAEAKGERIWIKDTVRFVTGKAKLKPESRDLLDAVVCLMNNPQDDYLRTGMGSIRVEGHTDSSGGDDMNMRLSQARAKSVADYLVQAGLAEDRVRSVGLGPTKPIASNKSRAGRAKNRRVEFHLTKEKPGMATLRKIKANMPKLPKPSAPMTSQHPDFPPELRAKNEGKRLTHGHMRRIIKEEMARAINEMKVDHVESIRGSMTGRGIEAFSKRAKKGERSGNKVLFYKDGKAVGTIDTGSTFIRNAVSLSSAMEDHSVQGLTTAGIDSASDVDKLYVV